MESFEAPVQLGGEVAKGFAAAVVVIVGAAALVAGILILRKVVQALSPRSLCAACNRYYSRRQAECPFCGEKRAEESDEKAETD